MWSAEGKRAGVAEKGEGGLGHGRGRSRDLGW